MLDNPYAPGSRAWKNRKALLKELGKHKPTNGKESRKDRLRPRFYKGKKS